MILTALLLAALLYEMVAIFNKKRGDTISERNWDVRDYSWWSRMILDTFLVWAFWHLLVDDAFFIQGPSWVDIVIIVIAAAISLWTWRRDTKKAVHVVR